MSATTGQGYGLAALAVLTVARNRGPERLPIHALHRSRLSKLEARSSKLEKLEARSSRPTRQVWSRAGVLRYVGRMTCPNCGAEDQAGRFCAECGAELKGECPSCGADLAPGAQFCAQCGAATKGGGGSRAPWWIAAAAALVVVLILLIPERADRAGPLPARDPGVGAPLGEGMGGFTGDIRTDADRLFNRVMTAAEHGQQDEVDQFMPMAIQAYEMVPALDDDGLFHLGILYQTAGDHEMARRTAGQILDHSPGHILALGVAGTSAAAMGDSAMATEHFRTLVDHYSAESGRLRPEYVDHQPMLDEYLQMARSFLEQR